MPHSPSCLDHDLAEHLCQNADLTEAERATCHLIALSAVHDEPVEAHTQAAFATLLRAKAAS